MCRANIVAAGSRCAIVGIASSGTVHGAVKVLAFRHSPATAETDQRTALISPRGHRPGSPRGNVSTNPDVQQRIAEAPTAREAAAIGRTPGLGIDPGWNAQRVDVMRWMLRMKRETNVAEIDAALAATGERPIVEVSTRDPW